MRDKDAKERQLLEKDAELARAFGFDATFVEQVPVANRPGVRFAHQATFHPLKYLEPLVRTIPGDGSFVLNTRPWRTSTTSQWSCRRVGTR